MGNEVYRLLRPILRKVRDAQVVEIGAHRGTDTVKLEKLLRPGYIYIAFEPDLRDLSALKGIMEPWTRGSWALNAVAVGNVDGTVKFHLSSGINKRGRLHTDSSSLKTPKDNVKVRPWMKFTEATTCSVRLDTVAKHWYRDQVDLLWMDVQGAELEVIEGGRGVLGWTRYLYTEHRWKHEMYEGAPDLLQILSALPGQWTVIGHWPPNVLLQNETWKPRDYKATSEDG